MNYQKKIKTLEEENINIKKQKDENKMMDSEYKSEGEEEYTMKKMVKASKKRNQSEDIKIDYPGLSNMKQQYEELEQCLFELLTKLKCNEEIRPVILNLCNILQLGDDMIKQILNE